MILTSYVQKPNKGSKVNAQYIACARGEEATRPRDSHIRLYNTSITTK